MPTIDIEASGLHEFQVLNDFKCANCGKKPNEVADESRCPQA